MSTNSSEHEAYRELEQAEQSAKYVPDQDKYAAHATAALAYATLALVREQQTANLIAYLQTAPGSSFAWAAARGAIEKRLQP